MSSTDLQTNIESGSKPVDNNQNVTESQSAPSTAPEHELTNGDDESCDEMSNHSLEEELETLSLSGDNELDLYTCSSCHDEFRQPRVLACLHVFCEDCLKPILIEDCIVCPTCQQTTEVESVAELPLDYVIANSLDMKGIQGMNMTCTSCKAKEKAVARCSDCANFLCPNCVTAHQFMRCFENHKVVPFEDITKGGGMAIHRPITCTLHGEEQPMKYFCNTCQIPICNECMMSDHRQPGHQVERVSDIERREMGYMKSLIAEAQQKVEQCDETSNNLQQSLTELESQRDDAKSLINETFQSYKAMLEKRQESLLSQLEQLHERQELSVMEMFHQIGSTVEKIDRGSDFVKRIVEKSNCLELLSLKKTMNQYMLTQMNKSLGGNVSVDLEFVTDNKKFATAVEDLFGHFKLRDESVVRNQQQHQQMQQIRQMERQQSRNNIASQSAELGYGMAPAYPDIAVSMNSGHMAGMMPPTTMLGSPDSGLSNDHSLRPILSNDFNSGSAFLPANNEPHAMADPLGLRNASVPSLSAMGGGGGGGMMTSSGGADTHQRSQSRQSQSPTISDSGIGMDSNSPGAHPNPSSPPFNLAALAKHGTVTLSPQGQVLLNNQPIPGLNVNNVTGFNHALPGGGGNLAVSNASSPDQELQMSHGSGMFSPPPMAPTGRSMSSMNSGNTIESVLSQRRESGIHTAGSMGGMSAGGMGMSAGGMMSSGGGGGSGFTSPTPSNQPGGSQFPLRSKMSAMQIRAKFGQLGPSKGQFNSPHGFCMGVDEDIVVADTNNHRVQVFDKSGDFKYQFGIPGREEGQLWYPRKVAVMRGTGRYVICDRGNERSRMQIFTKNGHFVKKIAIRYIDIVAGLAITPQGNIVAVDSVSPTVFTISEGGDLIKWFDCSDYMREPSDIAVADKEYFVCDFKGHCVVVFNDDGQFQRRIGTDSITNFPNGIDISDAGDILVGDSHGNRFHVAVFQRDGSLIGEFECPYVKVSRCCGLKITSEGYVVTLAKNNHHVLVLNTLYIS